MLNLQTIREDLHRIPEIGMKEYKTKQYISNILKQYKKGRLIEINETGIVYYFDFGKKESICLRSDIDALPIKEKNDVAYKSIHEGYMHACGHDGHIAMLLGAIDYITTLGDYAYNIACLFQPSEEIDGGAKSIIDSNILNELNVKYMFGMHLWPELDKGQIFTMEKGMLAKSSEVNIKIKGKAIHAANRKDGIDSIMCASEYILKLYELESKIEENHLLNFGVINGGTLRNIVAEETILNATMRAFSEKIFNHLKNNLFEVASYLENKYKTKFEIDVNEGFPAVYNEPSLVDKMSFAKKLKEPYMQAEDFGNYTMLYKCCFFLLGIGNTSKLHEDTFDFDSEVLYSGVEGYINILNAMK